MKKKIFISIFIVLIVVAVIAGIIVFLNSNKTENKEEKNNNTSPNYTTLSCEEILNNMSTTDKVAQMLMPAFRTYNNENVTKINDEIKEILQKYGFAGVILFSENNETTEQTTRLIDSMQNANAKERKDTVINCC